MSIHYIRETTFPLEEVLPYVLVGKPVGRDIYRIYAGKAVRMNSLRYQTFVVSGVRCVACGLEGQFFALERHATNNPNPERFHLNLYATKDGVEILFTKDHIKARSIGGKNSLDNFQTMCAPCNHSKGSHPAVTDDSVMPT